MLTRAPLLGGLPGRLGARAALATLALVACGQQQQAANRGAATPPAKAAAPVASAAPAKAEPTSACGGGPQLVPGDGFGDARGAFTAGSAPFRRLETNFAAAYRASCTLALLQRHPVIEAGSTEHDRLLVKNVPDANVVSIYLDGEEGAPASQRHMVLEYHYLTADGATHVPTESDLREAIFCEVQGATQQEEEASGRCLPD